MNWLDIVIGLLLVLAVWQGWRQGVITQILGLAALGLGILMAWRWGGAIGVWMGLEQTTAWVVGFLVVLVVVVLAAWLLGRLTRGLFRIVGLGVFDNILGVLFAALKMALFVGLFMMVVDFFDSEGRFIREGVRQGSVMYRAVDGVCDVVFPFLKDMFGKL